MSKFNVGDKVRLIDGDLHENISKHYPKINTVGIIKLIGVNGNNYLVQWPKGTTSQNDLWWVAYDKIELVEDKNMTNEEIWEMLRPKLVKNGLDWIHYGYDSEGNKFYYFDEKALMNAVATAYKSGYYRSQKGRPFKISEKKKKGGHWEPVDPENLPKEGTKVRYAREHNAYKNTPEFIKLGEIGTFSYSYTGTPGLKTEGNLFCPWVSFATNISCLDMWVEDDE